jgi:flavin reductase (DIM6/NTAB) family NADH-FMN oxidoreductase RutF
MSGVHTHTFGDDHAAGARALRDAFGCFTTGVTVVTTRAADGRPVGFTANSFASVSLDPPLALTSIDFKSNSLPHLEASKVFAVNVLHVDQQEIARKFTAKTGDRFEGVETELWDLGVPILKGCMANFELETHHAFDAGDHRVILGRILKVRYDPDHEPLVFLRGQYRKVHTDL